MKPKRRSVYMSSGRVLTLDTPTAVDDLGEYWSPACAKEAESYVRDVVYGGVDGYAYVRSLAEFVGGKPGQVRACLLFFSYAIS